MLFGRIYCRDLKNIAVVEDEHKLGGEKGADLVSSYIFFEGDIDENLEGKGKVSGTEYALRQDP